LTAQSGQEFAMKSHHAPRHWIAVALVLAFALLTLSNLYGQRSDGAATFRGRPAMAGAQGGTGAQAGLPQGGAGQQGTEGSERAIVTWPGREDNTPQAENPRQGETEPPPSITDPRDVPRKPDDSMRDKDSSIKPKKDSGMAKEERSATKKAKRAAKGTAERSRYGVSPIGSTAPAGG
jgi:hypothetical protein